MFIAQKLNSKLYDEFSEILDINLKVGHLPSDAYARQYNLYQQLKEELRTKVPDEYDDVYGRT